MKRTNIIFFAFYLVFFHACNQDDIIIVPKDYIIGKWETVQTGNWPNMTDLPKISGYTEYTADSVVRFFDYGQNAYTSQAVYWVTDSLLIESYWRSDGKQILFKTQYEFNKNWLRLDFVGGTYIYRTSILRKIH